MIADGFKSTRSTIIVCTYEVGMIKVTIKHKIIFNSNEIMANDEPDILIISIYNRYAKEGLKMMTYDISFMISVNLVPSHELLVLDLNLKILQLAA